MGCEKIKNTCVQAQEAADRCGCEGLCVKAVQGYGEF